MNSVASPQVICVGIAVADHVCQPIDHLPRAGELVVTDGTMISIGGCAANVSADLARLGVPTAIAGRVGRDLFGSYIRQALSQSGVDIQWLQESDAPTSCTLVVNVAGEDRRFVHCVGANDQVDGTEFPATALSSAKCVYVGGYGLVKRLDAKAVGRLFEQARSAGVQTVLDVVLPEGTDRREWVQQVLPLTDAFLPNTDEAALLTGFRDPLDQARQFQQWGVGTAIVTCGDAGAVLVDGRGALRTAGYRMPAVDCTGSGDAFDAGYILARLEGFDRETALTYAAAVGASCVRSVGATTGVFTRAELDSFLAEHPLVIEENPL